MSSIALGGEANLTRRLQEHARTNRNAAHASTRSLYKGGDGPKLAKMEFTFYLLYALYVHWTQHGWKLCTDFRLFQKVSVCVTNSMHEVHANMTYWQSKTKTIKTVVLNSHDQKLCLLKSTKTSNLPRKFDVTYTLSFDFCKNYLFWQSIILSNNFSK